MSKTKKVLVLGSLIAGSACASPYAMAAACEGLDATGSFAITDEYDFRGLDSSYGAAVQGSMDLVHCPTGLYLGLWGSNTASGSNGGTTEVDTYGGWRYQVGDWGLDVGAIGYLFPENRENGFPFADYGEGYVGLSWKWFSLTGYYAYDYFATGGDAFYLTGGFTYNLKPDLSLNIHAGYSNGDGVENVLGGNDDDYIDYQVMLTKNVQDIVDVGFGVLGTDLDSKSKKGSGFTGFINPNSHDDSPKFIVRVSKNFDI